MPERKEIRQRWTIDQIEEDSAAVEHDEQLHTIPRALIPRDAREGDVLLVTVSRDSDDRTVVTIAIDRAATKAAMKQSERQRAARPRSADTGGDIEL